MKVEGTTHSKIPSIFDHMIRNSSTIESYYHQTHLSPMEVHVRMKGTAPGGAPTGVGEKPACRDSTGYAVQR